MTLNEDRRKVLQDYARKRQADLTVVLENVHDPHNIGAILRSCDAVGIQEIFIIYTEYSKNAHDLYVGNRAARGTKKWVDVHFYQELDKCISAVKSRYKNIWATHLGEESKSVYDINLCQSTAIVFGNENTGISDELLGHCTGNLIIPIQGMVQSLNVSVAAAVSLYEAQRQRLITGAYDKPFDYYNKNMFELFKSGILKTFPRPIETDPSVLDRILAEERTIFDGTSES